MGSGAEIGKTVTMRSFSVRVLQLGHIKTMYTPKKACIIWLPSLLDVKVGGTCSISLVLTGRILTICMMRITVGHPRMQR